MTIVAAWMRAETGVGPSIASGSQTWSGNWALLPMAPAKISRAMAATIDRLDPLADPLETTSDVEVPRVTKMSMIPSAKPTSPTRLTMNAFLAASAADRLRYQKPISR